MDLIEDWKFIKNHFNTSFKQNLHVSIASVDFQNNPTITPIGSLFLNNDCTGFYFEKFPTKLPENAKKNKNICILAVNSSKWFWFRSLLKGRFKNNPALKLYGSLEEKREATDIEISRLQRRMRATKGLKGNTYLWKDMKIVRVVKLTKVEKINLGKMTL